MSDEMSREERAIRWRLWCVRRVRRKHIARLGEAGRILELPEMSLRERHEALREAGVGKSVAERAIEEVAPAAEVIEAFGRECDGLPEDGHLVQFDEAAYPGRLRDLAEPPEFLYVRGNLETLDAPATLAVVGSRDVTVKQARRAHDIVGHLARSGVEIVSGGAFGVDRVSHEAAIEEGRATVVVLPGGLDRPAPSSNRKVFEEALCDGAWVSEYALGTEVRPYHFPRRNRLIAALGDATFVVRAGENSGTMLTAEAAGRLGRPICTLPGGLDDPLAEGCNALLVEGAQAVRHGGDVLDIYFPEIDGGDSVSQPTARSRRDAPRPMPDGLSEDPRALVETVRESELDLGAPVELDELAAVTGWDAARLQTALLEVELHGLCAKEAGASAYRFR